MDFGELDAVNDHLSMCIDLLLFFAVGSCAALENIRLPAGARGRVRMAWEILWSHWYPSG